ncbi:MAG: DMT family transporter [Opitutaceae bacterium]|nr:DMT family transporter [Opitutaceae bacterium]
MVAAFLTTLFFSLSTIFANRSLRAVGATRANLGRLLFAALVLGAYAHLFGGGLGGAGRDWLLLSGVIGMGLGDLAVFAALPLLGSRLTVLMTQCLAAPLAIVAEWLWLGTVLTGTQLLWGFVILGGVLIALLPSRSSPPKVTIRPIGFLFGFLAACGQGFGAVVSRKGNALAALAGEPIDGLTAAYQRILGGLAITLIWLAARDLLSAKPSAPAPPEAPPPWRAYLWIPANAGCGAIIGVSCYQWSLATTPSGIVLPIVACTPLVIIPLSYWLENERPTRRSLLGGLIAVAGCIALALAR